MTMNTNIEFRRPQPQTSKDQENTTMNINRVEENNDRQHQLSPIEHDHEHQQSLGQQ